MIKPPRQVQGGFFSFPEKRRSSLHVLTPQIGQYVADEHLGIVDLALHRRHRDFIVHQKYPRRHLADIPAIGAKAGESGRPS